MADEELSEAEFEESEPDDDDGEMPWESHAREAVERVLAEAAFDEVKGDAPFVNQAEPIRVAGGKPTVVSEFAFP